MTDLRTSRGRLRGSAAARVTREDLPGVDPLGRTPTERAQRAGSNGRVLTA